MSTGFELLTRGQFFNSVMQPYIDIMGAWGTGVVFLSLIGVFCILSYIKTKSIEITGAIFIVSGSIVYGYLLPQAGIFLMLVIITAIALLLYKLLYKKRVFE